MSAAEYDLSRPWLRQPFDTDQAWALFSQWLLSPAPRSLSELARQSRWTVGAIESLAWEYGWKERAAAWDAHLDSIRFQTVQAELEESARAVAKRHGKAARQVVELAAGELGKLLAAAKSTDGIGLLRPADVLRFLTEGAKLERLVIGEVTERTESTGPDLARLDADDLRALRRLHEKAAGASSDVDPESDPK